VLTAGHVSGEPGRDSVFIILADGKRVRGKTLGLNRRIDSGLMQIDEKGPWPYVDMAPGNDIEPGQWVIATGHPGGFSSDRTPPVRLGRVLYKNDDVICTDCTLVGGDSGGPLFNMRGEVIGIHSRIGRSITSNFHVPIATYHDTWDRLAAGEVWGGRLPTDERGQVRPYLGMHVDGRGDGIRVTQVSPNTPAERAGIQTDDVILKFAGAEVASRAELIDELWTTEPGQRVEVEVKRGEETLKLRIVVGGVARPLPGSPAYEPRERRREPRGTREREPNKDARPEQQTPAPAANRPSGQQQAIPPQQGESRPDSVQQGNSPDDDSPSTGKQDGSAGTSPNSPAPLKKDGEPDTPNAGSTPRTPAPEADPLADVGIELDPVAASCVVSSISRGSRADLAGLRPGDVILSAAGNQTPDAETLTKLLARGAPSEGIKLTVRRDGRELALTVR
jgi:serine protease Do